MSLTGGGGGGGGRGGGGRGGGGSGGGGRGGGGGKGHNLTFIKHTPAFVAKILGVAARAEPVYQEREEREDRDDEKPQIVDAEDAKVSSKKRPAPARHAEPEDEDLRELPARPETTQDRFKEKPRRDAAPTEPAADAAVDDLARPIRFNAKPAFGKHKAPKLATDVPRAKKLENQKLLSFGDE